MFDKHFEAVLADCAESKRIHYKIRYQVYCIESGYEDRHAFPDGEEKDEWDNQSVHFLVRSKESGEWIAAMRLILPGSESGQPVFQLCDIDATITGKTCDSTAGEISRLCIINPFRRKLSPCSPGKNQVLLRQHEPSNLPHMRERCKEPLILLGLFRAAAEYSRNHNIPYWYFLTTLALARMLRRMNIHLIKAGSSWSHNGERHPFLIDLRDAVERARNGSRVIDQMLYNQSAYLRYSELYNQANQANKSRYRHAHAA